MRQPQVSAGALVATAFRRVSWVNALLLPEAIATSDSSPWNWQNFLLPPVGRFGQEVAHFPNAVIAVEPSSVTRSGTSLKRQEAMFYAALKRRISGSEAVGESASRRELIFPITHAFVTFLLRRRETSPHTALMVRDHTLLRSLGAGRINRRW
jgi:hypothetical protein